MDYSADVADRTSDLTISADWSETFARISAPPLAPAEQVIDLDHLARMTLGEAKLEREVLQLFDQQVEMLLDHMTSETPRVTAAFAHTLVGSARGIGAWKLAAAAEAVERIASGPGPTTLTAAMNRLSSAVAETQVAIAELLRERAAEEAAK
jgi:HPt (histidine-containing phosphotransfer) domain-containing protein